MEREKYLYDVLFLEKLFGFRCHNPRPLGVDVHMTHENIEIIFLNKNIFIGENKEL